MTVGAVPAKTSGQSRACPLVCRPASAVSRVGSSGRSARRAGRNANSAWPAGSTGSVRQSWAIEVSTPSGPSSRKVVAPAACRWRTQSANRTAARTCLTQYSGSPNCSAVARAPVTLETTGSWGGW